MVAESSLHSVKREIAAITRVFPYHRLRDHVYQDLLIVYETARGKHVVAAQ
jgi:hypothetical protein